MKILKHNRKENVMKLKVETPDDLWELEGVVEEGDLVSAKTMRRVMIQRKDGQEKGNKEPMHLTLEIEKIKFHEHTGNLRLTGPIKDGPEKVDLDSYHTIKVDAGKVLTIKKKDGWQEWQVKKIKRAYKKPPKVLVSVLDRNQATVARVKNDVKILSEIDSKISGKQYGESKKKEYIGEIYNILKRKHKDFDKVVVAGPGFMKEDLMERIKKDKELAKKTVTDTTSQTGETGVQEIIRRGVIDKISRDSRIAQETEKVDEIFKKLSQDSGEVAYGKKEVEKGVKMGAAEEIIAGESFLKEDKELIKMAEDRGAEVTICSERHEAGEKLKNIGGIAALLRYPIN